MVLLNICDRISVFIFQYIITAIIIPICGFFKPFFLTCNYILNVIKPRNTPERHREKVKYVQQQVLDWNKSGRKTQMCTGRPGWRSFSVRTPIYKDTMTGIYVNMGDIVQIDIKRGVVKLEPLMTMGRLSSILIPMGWTVPVLPELNDLTIGGLICGAGIETSSHKYGLFHNICVSYEIVLANGEVVTCTKGKNADLFHAIPGSCGTLGFLTAAEVMIIPAQKYMRLEYIPVHSLEEAVRTFESQTYRESGNDFIEGIMYTLDKGVIMVGNMSPSAESGKVNSIGRWYKPWFYKHVETFLKKNAATSEFIEYIPLRQYFHRHTRSLFWETVNFIPYGNNVIFRYIFGWVLPLRLYMLKLVAPRFAFKILDKNHVAQDFVVPMEKLKESLILSHKVTQVYPIWLCPAKLINTPGACHFLGDGDEMYVDFGIYGETPLANYELVKTTRHLELYCIENRGYQALYSDICLTREEFATMFDPKHYEKVRAALKCADAFPDIYDKVSRAARR